MEKTILNVNGMMCQHCQATVIKAVSAAGAPDVQVDLKAKTVTFTPNATATMEAVRSAITEAGYEVV